MTQWTLDSQPRRRIRACPDTHLPQWPTMTLQRIAPALLLPAHMFLGACARPSRSAEQAAPLAMPRTSPDSRDSKLIASIDSFARMLARADSFSGVVLLAHQDVPIYTYTAGLADRARGLPNRLDTQFNLASVDKFFTRIAIRQLQQAGKLSMTDRVGVHLPDYPNPRVRDEVTIQQLYEMRSGVGDYVGEAYDRKRATLRSLDDYLALFATDSLRFDPGTSQEYSNGGYIVLGKIIERVSGKSYYDYVDEHVFGPAGMERTGYFPPDDNAVNRAIPYTTSPKAAGDFSTGATALPERRAATALLPYRGSSTGGGYSSASDLLRLSQAIADHRLLSPAFTDSLIDLRVGPLTLGGWTGGSEGANAVFYMHTTGHTLIVLSNYDPPSATVFRRKLWSDWLPAWLAQ